MVGELARLNDLAHLTSLDAARVAKEMRSQLDNLPALFARHVTQARQMLRKLIDGHILCESILEDDRPGYRFAATGTFDRLLTGAKAVGNYGGGGEPGFNLFLPTIRVPRRASNSKTA